MVPHLSPQLSRSQDVARPPLSADLRSVAPGTACGLVPSELKVQILGSEECRVKSEDVSSPLFYFASLLIYAP